MQVNAEDVLKNIETNYVNEIASKNHEIAVLQALNAQLQSQLQSQEATKKEG